MTHQEANWLVYHNDKYELLRDTSKQLPMVARFGMVPVMISTGCYRGYVAEYEIRDNHLYLTSLLIQDAKDYYPEIGNVKADIDHYGDHVYKGLSEPMSISGNLVIGKDMPPNWDGFDIRMPHDYQTVLKITLQDGIVQSLEDISQQAQNIYKELSEIFSVQRKIWIETGKGSDYNIDRMNELMDQSFNLTVS